MSSSQRYGTDGLLPPTVAVQSMVGSENAKNAVASFCNEVMHEKEVAERGPFQSSVVILKWNGLYITGILFHNYALQFLLCLQVCS